VLISKIPKKKKESIFFANHSGVLFSSTGKILLKIYNKNKKTALQNQKAMNTKLRQILSKPETFLLAYRSITRNQSLRVWIACYIVALLPNSKEVGICPSYPEMSTKSNQIVKTINRR
jgi:hypothetical protein